MLVHEQTQIKWPLKKRVFRWAVTFLGVAAVLWIALGIIAKLTITTDFLIKEAEKSITSRVEIKSADLSLFSFPARVTLSGVSLRPVDESANDAEVSIERVDLHVSLFALLLREVNVKRIVISGADISTVYREDGSTTIEGLFKKPEKKKKKSGKDRGTKKKNGFNAIEQQDFVARLGEFKIVNSRARVKLEKMGMHLQCKNLNIHLDEIRVNPLQLHETNTANLSFSADVLADSTQGLRYGELFLTGTASALVFNQKTGEVEPNIVGDISIGDDSWLSTRLPYISKAWGLLNSLEKVGVKVAKIPEQATFGRSQAIAANYHQGRVTVLKALSIWVGDWELAALDGSWLDTRTDQHVAQAELLASEKASMRFFSLIQRAAQLFPRSVRENVVNDVREQLFRSERLALSMESQGDFSKPKIRAAGAAPNFIESGRAAGEKLLKEKAGGLLEGLLNP